MLPSLDGGFRKSSAAPLHQRARATVSTSTDVAPDFKRTLEHSSTVAPVVKTSSTSKIRFATIASALLSENAPRMFSRRSLFFKPVCCRVFRCRMRTSVDGYISDHSGARISASSGHCRIKMWLWLNPLFRRLAAWRGIGTSRSNSSRFQKAVSVSKVASPRLFPCRIRPLYLNAWITDMSAVSCTPTDRAFRNTLGLSMQSPQG